MLIPRSFTLPSGLRVDLRLPHGRDRAALIALHERLGLDVDDLEPARLLSHDPRRGAAVVATAWTPDGHTFLGFASGRVGEDEPSVLLVDPRGGEPLADLLRRALAERLGRPRVA